MDIVNDFGSKEETINVKRLDAFWEDPSILKKFLKKDHDKAVKLRTIFMGTSEFAKLILECLVASKYNIIGVLTQPDRPVGRKYRVAESPVKSLCKEKSIPFFQPEKIDKDVIRDIRELKPDIIILADYGKILPKDVLDIPGFNSINIHASLLPQYRGPSPIQNALINGEKETGTTIMLMGEKVDTGDIIAQKKVSIHDDEMFESLKTKLAIVGSALLLETIPKWITGEIKAKKQNDTAATMCQLVEREDGRIFWNTPAKDIYNKYRAFTPWPGIYTFWDKDDSMRRIKLLKIRFEKTINIGTEKKQIGEVFKFGKQVSVQTSDGVVIIDDLQVEGKQPMQSSAFVNGKPDFIGSILK